MTKMLFLVLLITTAWANPLSSSEYDYDYGYVEKPVEFLTSSQTLKVKEGDKVVLSCEATNPENHVLLIMKESEDESKRKLLSVGSLIITEDSRLRLIGSDQMQISAVRRSDAGVYKCQYQTHPPTELVYVLDVQYAPTFKFGRPEVGPVQEGDDLMLSCYTEGNPVADISWSRKGGRLPSDSWTTMHGEIFIRKINREDKGTYICTVDNGIGEVSDEILVTVEHGPSIIIEKNEGDSNDSKIELNCLVVAVPPPTVEWFKHGVLISAHSSTNIDDFGQMYNTIKIPDPREDDYGEYTCIGENRFGREESVIAVTAPTTMTSQVTSQMITTASDLTQGDVTSASPNNGLPCQDGDVKTIMLELQEMKEMIIKLLTIASHP